MKTLVILSAGLSEPSTTRQIADRIAEATVRRVTGAGEGLDVQAVDLRALATDLATYMTTFIPTPALESARRTVLEADALIAATPVFQGSYSGLFKMFFDSLDTHSLDGIPTTMVATAGTPRHSMVLDFALRPLLAFLRAMVLPTGVFVATDEFGAESDLSHRIDQAAEELANRLTVVGGVAGFTPPVQHGDAGPRGKEITDSYQEADFHAPDGGFSSLLRGHTGR